MELTNYKCNQTGYICRSKMMISHIGAKIRCILLKHSPTRMFRIKIARTHVNARRNMSTDVHVLVHNLIIHPYRVKTLRKVETTNNPPSRVTTWMGIQHTKHMLLHPPPLSISLSLSLSLSIPHSLSISFSLSLSLSLSLTLSLYLYIERSGSSVT